MGPEQVLAARLYNGDPLSFENFDALFEAFNRQLQYIVELKIRINNYIERMYATYAPAPFLSVVAEEPVLVFQL